MVIAYDINPRTFPPVRSASSCESSQRPPGLEHLLIEGVQIPFPVFLHPQTRPGCQIRIGSLFLSLSSTVRSWHMMTYVPCAALLYITKEQTSWRVAVYNFGCLQRLDALQRLVSTVSTVSDHNHADNHADNAHVSLGQNSTVFFAKKFTCSGPPPPFPWWIPPDLFAHAVQPSASGWSRSHTSVEGCTQIILHNPLISFRNTIGTRYLRLTNWKEATSMLKATAFISFPSHWSILEASCQFTYPATGNHPLSSTNVELSIPGSPGRPSSFIWISSWMSPSGSFAKLSESFMISSSSWCDHDEIIGHGWKKTIWDHGETLGPGRNVKQWKSHGEFRDMFEALSKLVYVNHWDWASDGTTFSSFSLETRSLWGIHTNTNHRFIDPQWLGNKRLEKLSHELIKSPHFSESTEVQLNISSKKLLDLLLGMARIVKFWCL